MAVSGDIGIDHGIPHGERDFQRLLHPRFRHVGTVRVEQRLRKVQKRLGYLSIREIKIWFRFGHAGSLVRKGH
jgi:hypothetical protein